MSQPDIDPAKWASASAASGATAVDFQARPCGICGERVRATLMGNWAQYHDCLLASLLSRCIPEVDDPDMDREIEAALKEMSELEKP